MIFVTVGTHEQQFNRLIEYVDNLKRDDRVEDEVIMQTGYSTYEPKYCKWNKIIPYNEMIENVKKARIVITHGGPASFILALQMGKTPIVVPRQYKYGEHVNNHQLDFTRKVVQKMGIIITVENIENLLNIIRNYDEIIQKMDTKLHSNNENFNNKLNEIVEDIFK